MLSLVEIECPHCEAKGQVLLPPLGTIIFGPCPSCNEIVALFAGSVIPLDKKVMTYGTSAEKREHLLEQLDEMLHEQLDQMFSDGFSDGEEQAQGSNKEISPSIVKGIASPISDQEAQDFCSIDLNLIDRKGFFDRIFGSTER